MIRKVLKLNNKGSLGIGLPSRFAKELNWTADDAINITQVGNTLHVTKIQID